MMGWVRGAAAALVFACVLAIGSGSGNAQQCVNDYERALKALRANAGECAKHNKLMTALTDAAGFESYGQGSPGAAKVQGPPGWAGIDTGTFNRDSKRDFEVYEPKTGDPRWRFEGGKVLFNCTVPLSPRAMPQNEAFLECARVYACASTTAACGINTARTTGSKDCKGITEQCMAQHPIPQGTMGPTIAGAAPPPQAPRGGGDGGSAPRTPPAAQVPPGPQQQAFQQMSPQCQAQLNQLLEGADSNDGRKATSAYANLRADCDAQIRHAAEAAHVGLPERLLSQRAQGAMAKAMGGDTGRIAQSHGGGGGGGGEFDVDQVISFGFALLGVLAGAQGFYAAIPTGAYYSSGGGGNFTTLNPRARSTYGQGAPSGPAPPGNRSTITGIK